MTEELKAESGGSAQIFCGVISVAKTSGHFKDPAGSTVIESLSNAGHKPLYYKAVMLEKNAVRTELLTALHVEGLKAVIITSPQSLNEPNLTIELAVSMFNRQLPGFAELFRMLLFKEQGPSAMTVTVAAGTAEGKLIFVLPDDPTVARLAVQELIIPELGTLIEQLSTDASSAQQILDDICSTDGNDSV
jgi:molybdenum cofactor biosynthesis protein B